MDKFKEVRKSLKKSAKLLKNSTFSIKTIRQNRKDITEKLKLIEENLENIKKILAARRNKNYPKKRKIINFLKGDFVSIDEYIDVMRKPLISESEANMVDWDKEFKDE